METTYVDTDKSSQGSTAACGSPSGSKNRSTPFSLSIDGFGFTFSCSKNSNRSASYSEHRNTMLGCCCCWPVHRCVTALSLLDTCIVSYITYKFANIVYNTLEEPQWFNVVALLFFFGFLVCQIIGTVFIYLAHKRSNRRYCYPRLTLLLGISIITSIACGIVLIYFCGAQKKMNEFFLKIYEWFLGEIDSHERSEVLGELKIYAYAFLILTFMFFLYSLFELLLTRKFYQSLRAFEPVPQHDHSSAPSQPAYNPEYA